MSKDQLGARSQDPGPDPVQMPGPAQGPGPGTQRLALYLKQPRPDPLWVASQLRYYPAERAAMMALLQQTAGNSFVQQVIAADQGGTATSPITFEPDGSSLPAPMPDGKVVDGGALGPVTTASATEKAEVTLPSVDAAVTSVENMKPILTISPAIPLSAIHAGQMPPEEIAQITNVTMIAGIAGVVSFQIAAGVLQLTLAQVPGVTALKTTMFKLWLASGETIALSVKTSMFHLETGVMDRAGTSAEIANEQEVMGEFRAEEAAALKSGTPERRLLRVEHNEDTGCDRSIRSRARR